MSAMIGSTGRLRSLAAALMASAGLAACATSGPLPTRAESHSPPVSGKPLKGTMKPYEIRGRWYYPREQPDYDETGVASWYGQKFHNRTTANGELFDMWAPSAAHKTLPLPSIVEVKNLDNGRKMRVRVNDRGPFVDGRIIDLSRAAAEELGFAEKGVARVRVRYVGPAESKRNESGYRVASNPKPEKPPVAGVWRVQAGAFASRYNAERVARELSGAGQTAIEEVERDGARLYRVIVGACSDEGEAVELLARVAASGFPGAQVLRPF